MSCAAVISNVNDIETKGQTFRYRTLLSEQKQNVLIWSPYYRNESRTFWFVPKNFLLPADLIRFGPNILRQSKPIWFGLEIVLGKVECFYLVQKLIDQSKRFWFGSLIIGTKGKHFDLVKKKFSRKQIVSVLAKKFWDGTKQFDLFWKLC